MFFPPDIFTERLRLVAITPALLRMEDDALSMHLRAEVPGIWPPEHWEPHVFDFLEQQYQKAPETIAWNRYVVLTAERPVLIGTLGGFPHTESEAEIGYSILQPWQQRGLATEGLRALMREIFCNSAIRSITAQTFPHLTASIRVLEKSGFCRDGFGNEEGTIRYRLWRPD